MERGRLSTHIQLVLQLVDYKTFFQQIKKPLQKSGFFKL